MGTKGFFLHGVNDVSVMALFFFMMVFMDTTATIPTGTMAERWTWKNFCLFGLWVAFPYCLYANWVWGGGWLAQLGVNRAWATVPSISPARAWCIRWAASSPRRRHPDRAAHRQVCQRQAACDPRAQHSDGLRRHVHPGLRLVRV